jgi:hypothetical protein
METKIVSSSGFSHNCTAQELYVLTRHWLSDLHFFEQEVKFLLSLVREYLLPSVAEREIDNIMILKEKLKDVQHKRDILKDHISRHQSKLSAILDKNPTTEAFTDSSHAKIEAEFFDFIKTYRKVKEELFKANECVQVV